MLHKRSMVLCLLILLCFACTGSAEETESSKYVCTIRVNGAKEMASQLMQTNITVYLNDEALQKDLLSLAYHIYSDKGELLYYEGERTELEKWENNEVNIPLEINLTSYGTVPLNGNVRIEFDIVNISGGYWFSTGRDIQLETDSIECKGDIAHRFLESVHKAIQRPVTILINLASIAVFIFILKKLKQNDFSII